MKTICAPSHCPDTVLATAHELAAAYPIATVGLAVLAAFVGAAVLARFI